MLNPGTAELRAVVSQPGAPPQYVAVPSGVSHTYRARVDGSRPVVVLTNPYRRTQDRFGVSEGVESDAYAFRPEPAPVTPFDRGRRTAAR